MGISEPDEISPLFYRPTQLHDIYANYEKYAAYIQQKTNIGYNLQLVTGLRLDYFSGTKETVISPRLNLKYTFNPSNAMHIAYGRHYQYPEYFMVLKSEFNQNLETEYTDQFIVGYEHFFANDFRATIELYHKYYNNVYTHYYWSHDPETYPEQLYHILDWENNGNRKNLGMEFLLHKKLSNNWHGILSYSNSTSRAKDVRNIKQVPEIDTFQDDGEWYPWDYDIHHKLTLIGGWKKKMSSHYWYKQLKSNNFFRILSPILPIADEIELSFRYAYTSGKPYTSRNYYPELFDWKYPDDANWNSSRFPDYKRLDLMFQKRHNYDKLNLVLYLNFINIFNRNNVLDWIYSQNGTKETVWHFKTLPIGGITIEL